MTLFPIVGAPSAESITLSGPFNRPATRTVGRAQLLNLRTIDETQGRSLS